MTENRSSGRWMNRVGPRMNRRTFVGSAAAVAGAAGLAGVLPANLARAATRRPREFDLSQVKHLVFQMQENRSFDHYFGAFPGARGFNDPTAIRLPNGRSVFQQPDPANPDGFLEPWHMSTITTGAAAVPSLSHDWRDQHASWNQGAMDGWLLTHIASDGETNGSFTMGYYEEEDIPFHWALARAFTLADNYHCAVMGPTDVNRIFWEEGGNDPQGKAGGPVLETGGVRDLTYESGPETLYNAGISYKFYQGIGWPQDTITLYFKQFQAPGMVPLALYNAVTSTGTLFGNGTPGGIGDPENPTPASNSEMGFEEDCANGVLPDVSFIGSKSGFDEHPAALPAAGAQFLATKLEALASSEELWNTTVFIINYDENDGFFDHVVPPTPNQAEYPEEFITLASPAGTPGGGLPLGAGFRVPAFVISPWTVGGQIFSDVSDHTSCLRLIEAVAAAGGLSGKGAVTFPNISRWRRNTFSDFTEALRQGKAQPAPSSTQFTPATTAANLAAQSTSALLPLPTRPGADQQTSLTLGPVSGLVLAPGASATVAATVSNNGPGSISKVSLTLSGAPSGWKVTAAGATTASFLAPESSLTATWQVTAPATAGPQVATLSAAASYRDDITRATKTLTAQQAPVPAPAANLSDDFDNIGISLDSNQGAANFDGGGFSYSATALGNAGLTPGATVTSGGLTFTWPNVAAGAQDNVLSDGQIILMNGTAGQTTLGLLGSSSNGASQGTIDIFYTDGTSSTGTVSFNDWAGGPGNGDTAVATMSYRNSASGSQTLNMYIYATTVAVDSSKTVQSVVLPVVNSSDSGTAMHIFALALGS
jgi:phospholipase C